MSYRIDETEKGSELHLSFQGILDEKAVGDITLHCRPFLERGDMITIRILEGSEVVPSAVQRLLGLEGVKVTTGSPFLSYLFGITRVADSGNSGHKEDNGCVKPG